MSNTNIQTDNTVLDLVISLKLSVATFPQTLQQSYDFHEIQLTQIKRGFVRVKVSHREHDLAYPNYSLKTCGGPEAFTSATIFKKCGGKASSGG